MPERKIIHIDMDAFFASVEQRDRPELRGRPVIVGGTPENRGVVCTASYEARVYGVHSALPAVTARKLCPHGIFLEPDGAKYQMVSHQIRAIFHTFTPLVEPLSIDEAFLDVTEAAENSGLTATQLARAIQRRIYRETQLTGSAGVSYNKFLAKMASGLKKPCGLSVITPEMAAAFLEQLPIGKFYGIGPATAERFQRMGIRSGRDLKALDLELLTLTFGKVGQFFYQIVRGIDPRPVEVNTERKSIGREITLPEDITRPEDIERILRELARDVALELRSHGVKGRTFTLKVRYENFQTVTRSQSIDAWLVEEADLLAMARELLQRTDAGPRPVRLLGLTASSLGATDAPLPPIQLEFDFDE